MSAYAIASLLTLAVVVMLGMIIDNWDIAVGVLAANWTGIAVAAMVIFGILMLLAPPAAGRGEDGW